MSETGNKFSIRVPAGTVWEDKNWGRVWHRFYDAYCGESLLQLTEIGQRCSMHYHEDRYNVFICVSGSVAIFDYGRMPIDSGFIRSEQDGSKRIRSSKTGCPDPHYLGVEAHILKAGESMTISTDRWHYFRVLEPAEIIEVYYSVDPDNRPVMQHDIVRFDSGCKVR